MINLLEIVGSVISPITNLIDNLTTTDKEKLELKNKLVEIQNDLSAKILDYQNELMKSQASIIKAEAQGESWLQRNWRPILMLTIVVIVANNYLLFPYMKLIGLHATMLELPNKLWDLMTIGVGGYIVGRSGEKIVSNLKK